jgi:hypothetical protein
MEAAALQRTTRTAPTAPVHSKHAAKLLPVMLTDAPSYLHTSANTAAPASARAGADTATAITIDIHGARVSINSPIDPATLTTVLNCFRKSPQTGAPPQPHHP